MAEGVPASFAQQVAALREQRLPANVGVMIPTYNRPDLARLAVLQFAQQSRVPDFICVHQNGLADSYQWCLDDLRVASKIAWLHTNAQLPQHQWYSIPLRWLLDHGCTHIFWADHDDFYLREHIEKGLQDLKHADCSMSARAGLLATRASDYRYSPQATLASGFPSTMCFNRRFALALLDDIEADTRHIATSDVVAQVTCPKFLCHSSEHLTAIHHAREGAVNAEELLARMFGDHPPNP